MNFTANLTKCVNHVSEYTAYSAAAATVGYGLTRTFTVLNPVAGATFFGSCMLAGVVIDPISNNKKPESKKTIRGINNQVIDQQQYSSKAASVAGKMAQFAFAWIATPYLTPMVTSTLSAITAEVLSTGSLVAGSVSLPAVSLPAAISLPVIGITALALVVIGGYMKKDQLEDLYSMYKECGLSGVYSVLKYKFTGIED